MHISKLLRFYTWLRSFFLKVIYFLAMGMRAVRNTYLGGKWYPNKYLLFKEESSLLLS
jgi:hypothetical protein